MLFSNGTVTAWGQNGSGLDITNVPSGLSNVTAIAVGPRYSQAPGLLHTFALHEDRSWDFAAIVGDLRVDELAHATVGRHMGIQVIVDDGRCTRDFLRRAAERSELPPLRTFRYTNTRALGK